MSVPRRAIVSALLVASWADDEPLRMTSSAVVCNLSISLRTFCNRPEWLLSLRITMPRMTLMSCIRPTTLSPLMAAPAIWRRTILFEAFSFFFIKWCTFRCLFTNLNVSSAVRGRCSVARMFTHSSRLFSYFSFLLIMSARTVSRRDLREHSASASFLRVAMSRSAILLIASHLWLWWVSEKQTTQMLLRQVTQYSSSFWWCLSQHVCSASDSQMCCPSACWVLHESHKFSRQSRHLTVANSKFLFWQQIWQNPSPERYNWAVTSLTTKLTGRALTGDENDCRQTGHETYKTRFMQHYVDFSVMCHACFQNSIWRL